jgi:TolB-like protein/Tfp pilus assembly protein PilF
VAALAPESTAAPASVPLDDDKKGDEKKKKKKGKVRAAWISFVGRVLAQVVGAAATVTLGIMIAGRMRPAAVRETPPSPNPRPARAAVVEPGALVAIAVLPLLNLSGDAKQEYFADGMTEELIKDLVRQGGFRVISRTSSMSYKDQRRPLPEIAQQLGVDLIVEGSVSRSGDRVRITAQLIDAKRDEHLWAGSYDRTSRDLLTLQSEVAGAIAAEVKGSVTPAQQGRLARRRAVEPQVYDLYLRGRHAWNLRTPDGFQQAIRFYEQAIQRDAGFSLAHAGLADAYSFSAATAVNRGETIAKAKAAARRALELDANLAEAHTALAALYHREDGNVREAEQEFQQALVLDPDYATAHQWYATLLAEQGRDADAMSQARQAVSLDPLAAALHQTLGQVHYYGRRYPEAMAAERRALELAPQLSLARLLLARALIAAGRPEAAIPVLGETTAPASADTLATLSLAWHRAGDKSRAGKLLEQVRAIEPLPTAALARFYAATGDRSAALDMLEQTFASRPRAFQGLMPDPLLDGLRSEERFARLVRRLR